MSIKSVGQASSLSFAECEPQLKHSDRQDACPMGVLEFAFDSFLMLLIKGVEDISLTVSLFERRPLADASG